MALHLFRYDLSSTFIGGIGYENDDFGPSEVRVTSGANLGRPIF